MSEAPPPRTGRAGGLIVALIIGSSAVGVVGWYLAVNKSGPALDATGFDLAAAPEHKAPALAGASAAPAPAAPASSLSMMKADAGIRIGGGGSPPAAPASDAVKEKSRADFAQAARRHETDVRSFAIRMTQKYPVIRQYGRDWMSYPDLRKLNDDYMRDRDPAAFMLGLARAPSLGAMVKKYAAAPEVREFVVEGLKQAPGELTSAALGALQNDRVIKDLVSNVVGGMGLPPSVAAMINGGADPAKIDQNKLLGEMMSDPQMKKALNQR